MGNYCKNRPSFLLGACILMGKLKPRFVERESWLSMLDVHGSHSWSHLSVCEKLLTSCPRLQNFARRNPIMRMLFACHSSEAYATLMMPQLVQWLISHRDLKLYFGSMNCIMKLAASENMATIVSFAADHVHQSWTTRDGKISNLWIQSQGAQTPCINRCCIKNRAICSGI